MKVGRAADPAARLKDLQCAASSPLVLLGSIECDVERAIHRDHAADRVCGEWFVLSDEVRELIADLLGDDALPPKPAKPRELVLPPFSVPRSSAEHQWSWGAAFFCATEGVNFLAGVVDGTVVVPAEFQPVASVVTTRAAYDAFLKASDSSGFDLDQFPVKYPATHASILAAAGKAVAS